MTDHSLAERGAIVAELLASQHALIRFMGDVDRIASGQTIDGVELSSTRWKLSQARRRNKSLVHAYLDSLSRTQRVIHADLVALLLGQSAKVMQDTARHSSQWNLQTVASDPRGYRDAIHRLRKTWIDVIDLERQLVDACSGAPLVAA